MSGTEALKRRRGRMGGGGKVQYRKTPPKNIVEMEQKPKVTGHMNAASKKSVQY